MGEFPISRKPCIIGLLSSAPKTDHMHFMRILKTMKLTYHATVMAKSLQGDHHAKFITMNA